MHIHDCVYRCANDRRQYNIYRLLQIGLIPLIKSVEGLLLLNFIYNAVKFGTLLW